MAHISFTVDNDSIHIDQLSFTDNEKDLNRRSQKVQQEYKDLIAKRFKLNNEIENKVKLFESLSEENSALKTVNNDLTMELDKVNKFYRDKKIENNIISSKKINEIKSLYSIDIPNPETDEETIKLKDEYEELEMNLKIKTKYETETKRKIKEIRMIIKNLDQKIKSESEGLAKAKVEIKNLENEHCLQKTLKEKNNSKEFHEIIKNIDNVLEQRLNIEKNVSKTKLMINEINNEIQNTNSHLSKIENEITKEQIILSKEIKQKSESLKKIKFFDNFLKENESFIKKSQSEIMAIKNSLKTNRNIYDKIEDNINYKLYFVKFSKTLMVSFFNIINARKIQLEMINNLSKSEKQIYDSLFRKLDEVEHKLIKEYKDYVSIMDEDPDFRFSSNK